MLGAFMHHNPCGFVSYQSIWCFVDDSFAYFSPIDVFFLSIFDRFGGIWVVFSKFEHILNEDDVSFFEHTIFFGFFCVDFNESFSDPFINFG